MCASRRQTDRSIHSTDDNCPTKGASKWSLSELFIPRSSANRMCSRWTHQLRVLQPLKGVLCTKETEPQRSASRYAFRNHVWDAFILQLLVFTRALKAIDPRSILSDSTSPLRSSSQDVAMTGIRSTRTGTKRCIFCPRQIFSGPKTASNPLQVLPQSSILVYLTPFI